LLGAKALEGRQIGNIERMKGNAVCELSQFGLARFSSTEAQAFLHSQLTCDVAALQSGKSTYGSYCSPKGRVLATFLLWRVGEDYFMQLPSPLREPIQKQLSKYILRAKVKAADASPEWTLIGVAGKDATAMVQRAAGGETVIKLPGERYEIAVTRGKAQAILAALASEAEKISPEYWDWLGIRAGVPVILPATQEAFVPQMLNLDLIGGVSLTKGCYPGQEIVARMHYRGTLKQRMYLANVAGSDSPQPGDKLYSPDFGEQACGTIVNSARSPEGGSDVLAVLQIASAEKGDVHWKALAGPALRFMQLPYSISVPG
jgi:folate-binding protein YgfZ